MTNTTLTGYFEDVAEFGYPIQAIVKNAKLFYPAHIVGNGTPIVANGEIVTIMGMCSSVSGAVDWYQFETADGRTGKALKLGFAPVVNNG